MLGDHRAMKIQSFQSDNRGKCGRFGTKAIEHPIVSFKSNLENPVASLRAIVEFPSLQRENALIF